MTSIQICANPVCREPYNADKVKLGGYCSHECRVDHQRAMNRHHLNWRPSNFMSDQHRERPTPNRVHGVDRKAQS